MGSVYIPSQTVTDIEVGTLSAGITNPYITLVINGVTYPNGLRVDYTGGFRNFSGVYDSGNGKIYIRCHTIAYGQDLPEFGIGPVEVLVIG